MKLWLLSQDENKDYDTYDSCVVAAETEGEARLTMPSKYESFDKNSAWCSGPDKVTVKLLGEAIEGTPAGVVLASFNAG